ncbi:MAG: viroplasmin family protein [Faecalibacillus sp.]
MAKYYAVKKGKKPGVYLNWEECKKQVIGYSGAIYKSFSTLNEANDFLVEEKEKPLTNGLLAYVDGSYNIKTKEYGYGCVLIEGQQIIKKIYGKGNQVELAKMRNVSGEILGCLAALEYAVNNEYKQICIYYDYEGIEKWATGIWKTNKEATKKYAQMIQNLKNKIDIHFIKVLAHSGDVYNEMADQLAKKAVGIKNV